MAATRKSEFAVREWSSDGVDRDRIRPTISCVERPPVSTFRLLGVATFLLLSGLAGAQPLPPPPVPAENPITEAKRVLGKFLFWEEQLSSDNSIACGTCHLPTSGGADPRFGMHPGFDGTPGTDDDVVGSPGVIRCDGDDAYAPDPTFGLDPQVTPRSANTVMMAAYADLLFWDGRADSTFVDPQTGLVSIPFGGGLESQAVAPILSDVEMAHAARDWPAVVAKLELARPLQLATNIPADLDALVQTRPTYPELFAAAFGDPAITAERIAFAIATYERTLIPDQTPWDAFENGNPDAMTPSQQQGWAAFQGSACFTCHIPPFFSDQSFRNIGLRPPEEDLGRQEVTGNPDDRGRFKVPTLRNTALKTTLMHNGQVHSIQDAIDFYLQRNGHVHFPDNIDPQVKLLFIPEPEIPFIIDFLRNGLLDPRAANGQFPFDRPLLRGEGPEPPQFGSGTPGPGGVPAMLAKIPPNVGNTDFKLGVQNALAGASAFVAMSTTPPVGGDISADLASPPITVDPAGHATYHHPIAFAPPLDGRTLFAQWIVADPGAAGGEARSPVVRLDLFCGGYCACGSDVNGDDAVDVDDLVAVITDWGSCVLCASDIDGSGAVTVDDLVAVITAWGACP